MANKKNKTPVSLYFIAIIPDAFFCEEVVSIKKYIRDTYGSGHALRSPAHITLHMPFKWRDDRLGTLNRTLKDFSAGRQRFSVELEDFGSFSKRVIFIAVNENDYLRELHLDLV